MNRLAAGVRLLSTQRPVSCVAATLDVSSTGSWRCISSCRVPTAASRPYSSSSSQSKQGPKTKEASEEAKYRARMFSIATGAATASIASGYILYQKLSAEEPAEKEETGEKENDKNEKPEKKRISFHDRRVVAYEDRIRAYSTPDKIFRYFATLKVVEQGGSKNIYMTPDDFVRSITPGMIQPQEFGLDLFRTVTLETVKKEKLCSFGDPDSVFNHFSHCGLISFSDYMFLLTMLSTPMGHFEIAFKMFDLNGDGEVDFDEFDQVRQVLLNSTAVGARHRDHVINGNVAGGVGGALEDLFFGAKHDQKLTIDVFRDFHNRLNTEILKMEFDRFEPIEGRISELDFAKLVLSSTYLNNQAKKKFRKRIKEAYGTEPSPGITFEEVKSFTKMLDSISDVDMALGMFHAAGASVTPAELKQTSKAAAGAELSEHLVEVVFTLFDEDNDGQLSEKEFIRVMKSRTSRGLQKSRDLGFARLLNSIQVCTKRTVKEKLGFE